MAARVTLARASESSPASIDATTGYPSASGLTFVNLEFDEVTINVETAVVEKADGSRRQTAEGGRKVAKSGSQEIRTGTITITSELDMIGPDINDETVDIPGLIAVAAFVNTLLLDAGAPADQKDVVATAGTAKQWTATTAANVPNGALVGFAKAGKAHSARVTGRSGSDLLINPALPFTPANTADARLMRAFYAAKAWSEDTIAIRYDGIGDTSGTSKGQRLIFFGLKLESIEIKADAVGRVVSVATLRSPYVEVDNANTDLDGTTCDCDDGLVSATAFDGGTRIAADYCGKGGTLATPANSDSASSWDTGLWSFKLTVGLTPKPGTNNNKIGWRGWRVGDATVELMIPMCATTVALDSDRTNGARRYIVIDAGTGGVGQGFSIHVNGLLKNDPLIFSREDGEHVQKLTFQSATYCNDSPSAPTSLAVNSWLQIAWWV